MEMKWKRFQKDSGPQIMSNALGFQGNHIYFGIFQSKLSITCLSQKNKSICMSHQNLHYFIVHTIYFIIKKNIGTISNFTISNKNCKPCICSFEKSSTYQGIKFSIFKYKILQNVPMQLYRSLNFHKLYTYVTSLYKKQTLLTPQKPLLASFQTITYTF